MKKSKIVVPALGILCLSTAAAVTGTVAWFTASRVKELTMSNIKVYNPESSLVMDVANVANTTVTAESGNTPANVAHEALRDASVDMSTATPAVWATNLGEDGQVQSFRSVASPYSAGTVSSTNIYYATVFTASFYLSASSGYEYALFFDSATSLSNTDELTAGTNDVISALRIGLKTTNNYMTWAPRTVDSGLKVIKATNTAAAGVDTDVKPIIHSTALPTVTDDVLAAGYNTNAQYLGIVPFKAASGQAQTKLTVTVYTWFEGTDSNCIPDAKGIETAFSAGLTFKMFRTA